MSIPVNNSLTASLEIELSGENDGNLYIIHKNAINTALILQSIIPTTFFWFV